MIMYYLIKIYNIFIGCLIKHLQLEAEAEGDAIFLRFFVKNLPPVDEEHEKVTIFRKESALYAALLPELQKYCKFI